MVLWCTPHARSPARNTIGLDEWVARNEPLLQAEDRVTEPGWEPHGTGARLIPDETDGMVVFRYRKSVADATEFEPAVSAQEVSAVSESPMFESPVSESAVTGAVVTEPEVPEPVVPNGDLNESDVAAAEPVASEPVAAHAAVTNVDDSDANESDTAVTDANGSDPAHPATELAAETAPVATSEPELPEPGQPETLEP